MSSMTDAFKTATGLHYFQNANQANVGDGTGVLASAAPGSVQLALATVAYVDADTLLTADEVVYTGYARPAIARSAGGWNSTTDTISNAALIQFGNMTAGGPDTVVHLGLGFIVTGEVLALHQTLAAPLVINDGVNPQFAIDALDRVFA